MKYAAALAAIATLAAPVWAAEPIPATFEADPAVKRGVMPNGLRYAVMRNASPVGAISIRLAMDVGSYDELDDERGIAHFVEHMAFRSTEQFPEGTLEQRFAPLGAAFGRDQNAATSLKSTVYTIDLPANAPTHLDAAFSWLRGVADGIVFAEQAVGRERGVLFAEKQARTNVAQAIQEEIAHFQAPHLRSMNRLPIGTDQTLRSISAKQLRSFYDRWYRPENGFLVVVGDAPVETLEAKAKAAFAGWTGRGQAGVRATAAAAGQARALEAFARTEPNFPTIASACRIAGPDPDPRSEAERLRARSLDQVWPTILNQRITLLAASKSSLLGGAALVAPDLPDAKTACLLVVPNGDKWQEALTAGQAELRRFAAEGPTEREVEQALESLRSKIRGSMTQAGTRGSTELATAIAAAELEKSIFFSPRQAMRAFNIAVDGISPEDVKAAFAADWAGDGPLIAVVTPKAPTKAEVLAAWKANEAAPALEAYADAAPVSWPYSSFGTSGKIIKREARTSPDYIHVEFENGTILRVKKTDFQEQGTEVRVRFGAGRHELGPDGVFQASMGAALFPAGGLGKLSFEDVQRVFANSSWQFSMGVHAESFILSASPLSSHLGREMQLLSAYMTDPAFRAESIDAKLPTAVDMVYRIYRTEPEAVALDALEKAVFTENWSLPPRDRIGALKSSDFERLLKPVVTQSPMLITIVGDVDPDEAIDAVADSFGALPKRTGQARRRADVRFHSYPSAPVKPIVASHEGPRDKAVGLLVWPLYVAVPERRQEEYAINILSQIFDSSLRRRLREQMGKTYSPTVRTEMIDNADQGQLAATMETTPADLDSVIAAARETAAELAAGKITQEELDGARQPVLAQIEQMSRNNGAWAAALTGEEEMKEFTTATPMLKAVSLEDVRKAAATWLGRQPMVSKAVPAPAKVQSK